jgi:hypothetical protein
MRSLERGSALLAISLILTILLLIGAVVFGGWAYGKMQDYKNNVDAKVSLAVNTAKQQESAAKDAEFAQVQKQPLKSYNGPQAYGSVTIQYPKSWSAYVKDDGNESPYVDGYFYPNVVPNVQNQSNAFALRVQVVQQSYSSVLNEVQSFVQQGATTVVPYKAAKVPSVIGVRIDGKISNQKNGSMVVLPLRNMTLKIWTEAPSFQVDFTNNILPNFTFAP